MVVLIGVSASALHLVFPLSIVIAILLGIVALSYTQVVRAYETSGGAYVVAKDNFGVVPALVAAAALLVDYVLTVSVSVAGGIFAITSAVPSLAGWNVKLCVLAIVADHVRQPARRAGERDRLRAADLRVHRLDAVLIVVGLIKSHPRLASPGRRAARDPGGGRRCRRLRPAAGICLRIERADRRRGDRKRRQRVQVKPQSSNAAKTLLMMASVAIFLFLGVSYLAVRLHARPSESVSVLSEIANAVFPSSSSAHFMFWVIQVFTFGILILAANTSYQGFPRLAAIMAKDGFFPRQFSNLGDRLVFSNGVRRARAARNRADPRLQRQRQLAHPPLRARRLHGVHDCLRPAWSATGSAIQGPAGAAARCSTASAALPPDSSA